MDLSIIIVSWNTRELLAQCLRSLEEDLEIWRSSTVETIVVDNASSDGTQVMLREQFPWVELVENSENVGFSRANNQAFLLSSGKKMLLLNPDTVVTEGAVILLSKVLDAIPEAGIVGAQLLNEDGSLQSSFGAYPSLWAELPIINRWVAKPAIIRHIDVLGSEQKIKSVNWVVGACLMIQRDVYEAIGSLDENYWLYTEEADWCYRAHTAGWKVLLVPQARVYHYARAASRQRYEITMLHFYQSRVRFVRKHFGVFNARLIRGIFRLKATIWMQWPTISPLHNAFPDLPLVGISSAYCRLMQVMDMQLDRYLAATWRV